MLNFHYTILVFIIEMCVIISSLSLKYHVFSLSIHVIYFTEEQAKSSRNVSLSQLYRSISVKFNDYILSVCIRIFSLADAAHCMITYDRRTPLGYCYLIRARRDA